MTAADVTRRIINSDPGVEVVVLTVSDGETYTSQKFNTILGAVACANQDSDAEINVTYSGAVATVNWASVSDGVATLVLYGNLGN